LFIYKHVVLNEYTFVFVSYPSDFINPKEKGKQYCLDYIKEMNVKLLDSKKVAERVLFKRYAEAMQPETIYREFFNPRKDGEEKKTHLNTNFRNLAILPKYRNIVTNYLKKRQFDVYMDSINPISLKAKEDAKMLTKAKMELKPVFDELDAKYNLPRDNEELPENDEELELQHTFGFRLPYEAQMENIVEMVTNDCEGEDILSAVANDQFCTGYGIVKSEIDVTEKKPIIQYCPIEDMIWEEVGGVSRSRYVKVGQYCYKTIGDIRREAGSEFTEQEYEEIARANQGRFGNANSYNFYLNEHHDCLVKVLDAQWFSLDIVKTLYSNNRGNELSVEVDYNTKVGVEDRVDSRTGFRYTKEVKETPINRVYEGKWIVGTEYIYNYGRARNVAYNAESPKTKSLKWNIVKSAETSCVSSVIEYVDAIQLNWIRARNMMARLIPDGAKIDFSRLEDMIIDGKKVSPQEMVKTYFDTGILMSKTKSFLAEEDGHNPKDPIEIITGSSGMQAKVLFEEIQMNMENIRQALGINDAMDASSPSASQLVGVQKIALQGSQNAIDHLAVAQNKMIEKNALSIALNAQMICRYGTLSGYLATPTGKKLIEVGNEISEIEGENIFYSVRIQARPTEAELQMLMQTIDLSVKNAQTPDAGGLDADVALELKTMLLNGVNMKLVMMLYRNRLRKAREEAQKVAQANTQSQSQAIQEQMQTKSQLEDEALKKKMAAEKELYAFKTDQDIRKIKAEKGFDMALENRQQEHEKELQTRESVQNVVANQ